MNHLENNSAWEAPQLIIENLGNTSSGSYTSSAEGGFSTYYAAS